MTPDSEGAVNVAKDFYIVLLFYGVLQAVELLRVFVKFIGENCKSHCLMRLQDILKWAALG